MREQSERLEEEGGEGSAQDEEAVERQNALKKELKLLQAFTQTRANFISLAQRRRGLTVE